jgi:hypothetical protein
VERTRKDLARELVTDVRLLDDRLKNNKQRIQDAVADSGSTLTDIAGVGPVVAARLLGRTGPASRFPTSAAFAVYAGVAPIEIASADKTRHRLSRQGDRKLNNTLHTIALTQMRMHSSRGRVYYDRKITEGKTHNEAMRCLKRRLADHVWPTMIADEHAHTADPAEHSATTLNSSAANPTPSTDSSDKSLPEPRRHRPYNLTNTEEPPVARTPCPPDAAAADAEVLDDRFGPGRGWLRCGECPCVGFAESILEHQVERT